MSAQSPFSPSCCVAAGFAAYVSVVYLHRYRSLHRLEVHSAPTTVEDAHPILDNFMCYDYPLFTTLSLEIGFLKTYGIPSISSILAGSREITDRPAKRIDDTNLIMREIIENKPTSERSRNAIRRMNALHGKYKNITNADFLYVLSIFICEPMRLAELYGYRGVHPYEKQSSFLMFQHIGSEMGIRDIFDSYEEAEKYMLEYEDKFMRFSPKNVILAESSVAVALKLFPSCLHGCIKHVLHTLAGPALRSAMGFPTPAGWVQGAVHSLLVAAKWAVKILLPPRPTFCYKRRTNPTTLCPFSGQGEGDGESNSSSSDVLIAPPYFDPYSAPAYAQGYRIGDVGPTRYRGEIDQLHSEKHIPLTS